MLYPLLNMNRKTSPNLLWQFSWLFMAFKEKKSDFFFSFGLSEFKFKFLIYCANHSSALPCCCLYTNRTTQLNKNTHHIRHAIYPERQQIIYWVGGHCGKVPLFFSPFIPTASASIDHCLRKRVCGSNAFIKTWTASANPYAVGVGIDFGYQIGSFLSWAVINI